MHNLTKPPTTTVNVKVYVRGQNASNVITRLIKTELIVANIFMMQLFAVEKVFPNYLHRDIKMTATSCVIAVNFLISFA